MSDISLRFLGMCLVLLVLWGIPYAIIIVKWPFGPGKTWQSVVFGDFTNDIGAAGMILLLTGNIFAALCPFVAHAMTGGPMIVGQIAKDIIQDEGNLHLEDEDGDTPQTLA